MLNQLSHINAACAAAVALCAASLTFRSAAAQHSDRSGPQPVAVFTDVTATAGIGLPDVLTESLAWGDYDNDGDEDLYLTNNGANNLFRNDGGDVFTDVTTEAGVGNASFSVGTAFGDLDNDGDLDLYVVNFNSGPDVLYRNDGPNKLGQYTFTDVAAIAGITIGRSSRGIAFIDFDHDGLLDIYVNAIGEDILYHNQGGLTFVDVAAAHNLSNPGQGVGVVATDVDNNGWVDLFTGNRSNDLNRLYMNGLGALADATVAAGINETGLGMGVLSFDYDNDLDFDLYWTCWPKVANALYENTTGRGATFTNVAVASNTDDPLGWGISCNAGDIDNDSFEDFFVTNGFSDTTTPNVLFHNGGNKSFNDVTSIIGGGDFDGRGVAFADYDGDGDIDLCVTADAEDTNRLWRNDTNNANQWITFTLNGTSSNRSGIGARIEVTTNLGTTVKEVSGGAGRGSFNSLPVEFGLGAATAINSVLIKWPNGIHQTLTTVALDQILDVEEPITCASDISGFTNAPDGTVNVFDLLELLSNWGTDGPGADIAEPTDIVDVFDLLELLSDWGPCAVP